MNSFYSIDELKEIGFKEIGDNVLISRKSSIYGAKNISIGNNVRIDDFSILSGNISIGNYVHIAAGVMIFAGEEGVVLEDFVGVSSRTAIYAVTDDYSGDALTNPMVPDEYRNIIGGKVILKKHALIGTGCTILPNVTVGEGASVGSMSLINKNIEDFTINVGIPAKFIKKRNNKMLLLEKQLIDE